MTRYVDPQGGSVLVNPYAVAPPRHALGAAAAAAAVVAGAAGLMVVAAGPALADADDGYGTFGSAEESSRESDEPHAGRSATEREADPDVVLDVDPAPSVRVPVVEQPSVPSTPSRNVRVLPRAVVDVASAPRVDPVTPVSEPRVDPVTPVTAPGVEPVAPVAAAPEVDPVTAEPVVPAAVEAVDQQDDALVKPATGGAVLVPDRSSPDRRGVEAAPRDLPREQAQPSDALQTPEATVVERRGGATPVGRRSPFRHRASWWARQGYPNGFLGGVHVDAPPATDVVAEPPTEVGSRDRPDGSGPIGVDEPQVPALDEPPVLLAAGEDGGTGPGPVRPDLGAGDDTTPLQQTTPPVVPAKAELPDPDRWSGSGAPDELRYPSVLSPKVEQLGLDLLGADRQEPSEPLDAGAADDAGTGDPAEAHGSGRREGIVQSRAIGHAPWTGGVHQLDLLVDPTTVPPRTSFLDPIVRAQVPRGSVGYAVRPGTPDGTATTLRLTDVDGVEESGVVPADLDAGEWRISSAYSDRHRGWETVLTRRGHVHTVVTGRDWWGPDDEGVAMTMACPDGSCVTVSNGNAVLSGPSGTTAYTPFPPIGWSTDAGEDVDGEAGARGNGLGAVDGDGTTTLWDVDRAGSSVPPWDGGGDPPFMWGGRFGAALPPTRRPSLPRHLLPMSPHGSGDPGQDLLPPFQQLELDLGDVATPPPPAPDGDPLDGGDRASGAWDRSFRDVYTVDDLDALPAMGEEPESAPSSSDTPGEPTAAPGVEQLSLLGQLSAPGQPQDGTSPEQPVPSRTPRSWFVRPGSPILSSLEGVADPQEYTEITPVRSTNASAAALVVGNPRTGQYAVVDVSDTGASPSGPVTYVGPNGPVFRPPGGQSDPFEVGDVEFALESSRGHVQRPRGRGEGRLNFRVPQDGARWLAASVDCTGALSVCEVTEYPAADEPAESTWELGADGRPVQGGAEPEVRVRMRPSATGADDAELVVQSGGDTVRFGPAELYRASPGRVHHVAVGGRRITVWPGTPSSIAEDGGVVRGLAPRLTLRSPDDGPSWTTELYGDGSGRRTGPREVLTPGGTTAQLPAADGTGAPQNPYSTLVLTPDSFHVLPGLWNASNVDARSTEPSRPDATYVHLELLDQIGGQGVPSDGSTGTPDPADHVRPEALDEVLGREAPSHVGIGAPSLLLQSGPDSLQMSLNDSRPGEIDERTQVVGDDGVRGLQGGRLVLRQDGEERTITGLNEVGWPIDLESVPDDGTDLANGLRGTSAGWRRVSSAAYAGRLLADLGAPPAFGTTRLIPGTGADGTGAVELPDLVREGRIRLTPTELQLTTHGGVEYVVSRLAPTHRPEYFRIQDGERIPIPAEEMPRLTGNFPTPFDETDPWDLPDPPPTRGGGRGGGPSGPGDLPLRPRSDGGDGGGGAPAVPEEELVTAGAGASDRRSAGRPSGGSEGVDAVDEQHRPGDVRADAAVLEPVGGVDEPLGVEPSGTRAVPVAPGVHAPYTSFPTDSADPPFMRNGGYERRASLPEWLLPMGSHDDTDGLRANADVVPAPSVGADGLDPRPAPYSNERLTFRMVPNSEPGRPPYTLVVVPPDDPYVVDDGSVHLTLQNPGRSGIGPMGVVGPDGRFDVRADGALSGVDRVAPGLGVAAEPGRLTLVGDGFRVSATCEGVSVCWRDPAAGAADLALVPDQQFHTVWAPVQQHSWVLDPERGEFRVEPGGRLPAPSSYALSVERAPHGSQVVSASWVAGPTEATAAAGAATSWSSQTLGDDGIHQGFSNSIDGHDPSFQITSGLYSGADEVFGEITGSGGSTRLSGTGAEAEQVRRDHWPHLPPMVLPSNTRPDGDTVEFANTFEQRVYERRGDLFVEFGDGRTFRMRSNPSVFAEDGSAVPEELVDGRWVPNARMPAVIGWGASVPGDPEPMVVAGSGVRSAVAPDNWTRPIEQLPPDWRPHVPDPAGHPWFPDRPVPVSGAHDGGSGVPLPRQLELDLLSAGWEGVTGDSPIDGEGGPSAIVHVPHAADPDDVRQLDLFTDLPPDTVALDHRGRSGLPADPLPDALGRRSRWFVQSGRQPEFRPDGTPPDPSGTWTEVAVAPFGTGFRVRDPRNGHAWELHATERQPLADAVWFIGDAGDADPLVGRVDQPLITSTDGIGFGLDAQADDVLVGAVLDGDLDDDRLLREIRLTGGVVPLIDPGERTSAQLRFDVPQVGRGGMEETLCCALDLDGNMVVSRRLTSPGSQAGEPVTYVVRDGRPVRVAPGGVGAGDVAFTVEPGRSFATDADGTTTVRYRPRVTLRDGALEGVLDFGAVDAGGTAPLDALFSGGTAIGVDGRPTATVGRVGLGISPGTGPWGGGRSPRPGPPVVTTDPEQFTATILDASATHRGGSTPIYVLSPDGALTVRYPPEARMVAQPSYEAVDRWLPGYPTPANPYLTVIGSNDGLDVVQGLVNPSDLGPSGTQLHVRASGDGRRERLAVDEFFDQPPPPPGTGDVVQETPLVSNGAVSSVYVGNEQPADVALRSDVDGQLHAEGDTRDGGAFSIRRATDENGLLHDAIIAQTDPRTWVFEDGDLAARHFYLTGIDPMWSPAVTRIDPETGDVVVGGVVDTAGDPVDLRYTLEDMQVRTVDGARYALRYDDGLLHRLEDGEWRPLPADRTPPHVRVRRAGGGAPSGGSGPGPDPRGRPPVTPSDPDPSNYLADLSEDPFSWDETWEGPVGGDGGDGLSNGSDVISGLHLDPGGLPVRRGVTSALLEGVGEVGSANQIFDPVTGVAVELLAPSLWEARTPTGGIDPRVLARSVRGGLLTSVGFGALFSVLPRPLQQAYVEGCTRDLWRSIACNTSGDQLDLDDSGPPTLPPPDAAPSSDPALPPPAVRGRGVDVRTGSAAPVVPPAPGSTRLGSDGQVQTYVGGQDLVGDGRPGTTPGRVNFFRAEDGTVEAVVVSPRRVDPVTNTATVWVPEIGTPVASNPGAEQVTSVQRVASPELRPGTATRAVRIRTGEYTQVLAGIPGGSAGSVHHAPTGDPRTERVMVQPSELVVGPNGDGLVISGRVPRGSEQAFLDGQREFWVSADAEWTDVEPTVVVQPSVAAPPPVEFSAPAAEVYEPSPALGGANPAEFQRRGPTAAQEYSSPERLLNRDPAPASAPQPAESPQQPRQVVPPVPVPIPRPVAPPAIPNPLPFLRDVWRFLSPAGGTVSVPAEQTVATVDEADGIA